MKSSQYDSQYLNGESLMMWAVRWFNMSNDDFFRSYGFNFNPHAYTGLYEEARERVCGNESQ